jgi:hypothetical protein
MVLKHFNTGIVTMEGLDFHLTNHLASRDLLRRSAEIEFEAKPFIQDPINSTREIDLVSNVKSVTVALNLWRIRSDSGVA